MRITAKHLNEVLSNIAKLSDKSTSQAEAESKGQDRFLYLEYASVYGGYRLVNVKVESGGHSGAFGKSAACSRMKASEMLAYLEGIEVGLSI